MKPPFIVRGKRWSLKGCDSFDQPWT